MYCETLIGKTRTMECVFSCAIREMKRISILTECTDQAVLQKRRQRLEEWHRCVETRALNEFAAHCADDIKFYSPVMKRPKSGKEEVFELLSAVGRVFRKFEYHRELLSESIWVLEFVAHISVDPSTAASPLMEVHGVDILQWNKPYWLDDAKVTLFHVMMRPLAAVQQMSQNVGSELLGGIK